ncbi:MAG: hypothetical protein JNM50_11950 [Chromatiales bacterium]|nr:hypothetical protein [Chromatiales bacterium]
MATASTIGGRLDLAALRVLHRPTSRDGLAAEARRLHRQGFTAHDIGEMLGLSPGAVAALLVEVAA